MGSKLASHWGLDPDVVFLNHGSFGATPTAVLEEQSKLRANLERQPIRFILRELADRMVDVRASIAEFLGADPERLVFTENATTSVNAVLRSLTFSPGDEILVSNHEYNACRNAVDFVAKRSGATVVEVQVPFPIESPQQVIDAVMSGVTESTKLVLLDHVTSQTAVVMPIRELVEKLSARGVETLIDGAHAPGMLPLDLDAIGATYYAGNFHKWVCAPKTSAFLYVAEDRIKDIRPTTISHGANQTTGSLTEFFRGEFDWVGTSDPTPLLCVPVVLEYMSTLVDGGWDAIYAHNRTLVLEGRQILNDALGASTCVPEAMIGSIATVQLKPGQVRAPGAISSFDPTQDALWHDHKIEVPVVPWPKPGDRLLRISAQLYNDRSDYERLAEALRGLE